MIPRKHWYLLHADHSYQHCAPYAELTDYLTVFPLLIFAEHLITPLQGEIDLTLSRVALGIRYVYKTFSLDRRQSFSTTIGLNVRCTHPLVYLVLCSNLVCIEA